MKKSPAPALGTETSLPTSFGRLTPQKPNGTKKPEPRLGPRPANDLRIIAAKRGRVGGSPENTRPLVSKARTTALEKGLGWAYGCPCRRGQ